MSDDDDDKQTHSKGKPAVPDVNDPPAPPETGLPPAIPNTSATEAGAEYDDRINKRRWTLSVVSLVLGSLTFLGLIAILAAVLLGEVEKGAVLVVASLAALTAFFYGTARRDLIPYQFLYRAKNDDDSKTWQNRIVDAGLKKLPPGQ